MKRPTQHSVTYGCLWHLAHAYSYLLKTYIFKSESQLYRLYIFYHKYAQLILANITKTIPKSALFLAADLVHYSILGSRVVYYVALTHNKLVFIVLKKHVMVYIK